MNAPRNIRALRAPEQIIPAPKNRRRVAPVSTARRIWIAAWPWLTVSGFAALCVVADSI